MPPYPIDPKRTAVKASRSEWLEPPVFMGPNDRWHAPPGTLIVRSDGTFLLACPGCGQIGSGRDGATWQVTAGSWADVTTLTLSPSIAKSCCGWHGYLRGGLFESC